MTLSLENGDIIHTAQADDRIKYLGFIFLGELVFKNELVTKLNRNLNELVNSSLLIPDQSRKSTLSTKICYRS